MAKVECLVCGRVGSAKTKGSFLITIVLLFIGLLPGIIYEIWRRSGGKVCGSCGSQNIRLYSPLPKQIQQPTQQETQPEVFKIPSKTKLVANDIFSNNAGNFVKLDENGVEQKNCPDCRELIRFDARKCKHCGSILEKTS